MHKQKRASGTTKYLGQIVPLIFNLFKFYPFIIDVSLPHFKTTVLFYFVLDIICLQFSELQVGGDRSSMINHRILPNLRRKMYVNEYGELMS